eukprot:TRINITY_DN135005_c0_g1_i1.p2 TRINITY_DN135005_c0_g1~~TRINITY_DN135005_c0_g1_i1.p2  ORF type:complete len:179 (-),score=3.88 TRINITY_DN135005_c0_g1_i1:76-612(-)
MLKATLKSKLYKDSRLSTTQGQRWRMPLQPLTALNFDLETWTMHRLPQVKCIQVQLSSSSRKFSCFTPQSSTTTMRGESNSQHRDKVGLIRHGSDFLWAHGTSASKLGTSRIGLSTVKSNRRRIGKSSSSVTTRRKGGSTFPVRGKGKSSRNNKGDQKGLEPVPEVKEEDNDSGESFE